MAEREKGRTQSRSTTEENDMEQQAAPSVVMDTEGFYWRRYPTALSMCPTTDANTATVVHTEYVPKGSEWADDREQVVQALDFIDQMLARRRERGEKPLPDQHATDWLRDRLLGGKGCVIAPFDARRPDFEHRDA